MTEHAGKSAEEIATLVGGLDETGRACLTKAVAESSEVEAATINRASITENAAKIHKMYLAVTLNKEDGPCQGPWTYSQMGLSKNDILCNFTYGILFNYTMSQNVKHVKFEGSETKKN